MFELLDREGGRRIVLVSYPGIIKVFEIQYEYMVHSIIYSTCMILRVQCESKC